MSIVPASARLLLLLGLHPEAFCSVRNDLKRLLRSPKQPGARIDQLIGLQVITVDEGRIVKRAWRASCCAVHGCRMTRREARVKFKLVAAAIELLKSKGGEA